jgi:hypothetical protein
MVLNRWEECEMLGCLRFSVGTLLILGALLTLAPAGCEKKVVVDKGTGGEASKVTKENFDKLKDGMTEKDAIAILGPATETKDAAGGTKEYIWKSGNNMITLGMKDGKVEYKMSQIVTIK